jgi:tyrosine-protein kinase Etk/Wzc
LAKVGKSVLLLDFDMHKPKVHKALNLPNDKGLSSYLIGRDSLEEVIQPSEIDSLDVVLAGPVPPNASELVLSEKVALLIQEAKKRYDYVVIDTPPLGLISDGLVLMKEADVGLFVMSTAIASRQGLQHIEEIIEKSQLDSYGLLLNNIKPQKWSYYYSKYGYYYGYGYGYGAGYGQAQDKRSGK